LELSPFHIHLTHRRHVAALAHQLHRQAPLVEALDDPPRQLVLGRRWLQKVGPEVRRPCHCALSQSRQLLTLLSICRADDLIPEESETVLLALKRLPPKEAYDRVFRMRRAFQVRSTRNTPHHPTHIANTLLQCSISHQLLPQNEQTKPEEVRSLQHTQTSTTQLLTHISGCPILEPYHQGDRVREKRENGPRRHGHQEIIALQLFYSLIPRVVAAAAFMYSIPLECPKSAFSLTL
jgi:hypothetical protein